MEMVEGMKVPTERKHNKIRTVANREPLVVFGETPKDAERADRSVPNHR